MTNRNHASIAGSLPEPDQRHLVVRALGPLSIELNGHQLNVQLPRKAQALLVYLVMTGTAHPREFLADLLWDEKSSERAMGNLRVLLTRLRDVLGDYLEITRHRVSVHLDATIWTDVAAMDACLEPILNPEHAGAVSLATISKVLALYRGDFLSEFFLADSIGFENWAHAERSRLRQAFLDGAAWAGSMYATQGHPAEGLALLRHVLKLEPLDERTNRLMMQLLMASGQRQVALQHFETFSQRLRAELGLEPEQDSIALAERISHESASAIRPSTQNNLPHLPSIFVGRVDQIATLATLLHDPTCRIITLAGPGGAGKTRLAMELARRSMTTFHGVYFVPLADLPSPDLISIALASAMRLRLLTSQEPQSQIISLLRKLQCLLVLDGFEHLLEARGLLGDILRAAPHLKIIVTSRVSTGIKGEWLWELHGLDAPVTDGEIGAEEYDSVRLFTTLARRLNENFDFVGERASILKVCRLVEGLPLAIELAVGCLGAMPCGQIAQTLEANAGRHVGPDDTAALSDRLIRNVLNLTWTLLTPAERAVMAKLAVFQNGFSASMATNVCGTDLVTLSALERAALIRREEADRFSMHGVIRHYAEGQLKRSGLVQATRDSHAARVLQALVEHGKHLEEHDSDNAVALIEADLANVRAAWDWAILRRDQVSLTAACPALSRFLSLKGWHFEAIARISGALAPLSQPNAESSDPWHEQALRLALTEPLQTVHGYARTVVGENYARLLALSEQIGDERTVIIAREGLANYHLIRAEWAEARAHYEANMRDTFRRKAIYLTGAANTGYRSLCLLTADYERVAQMAEEEVRQIGLLTEGRIAEMRFDPRTQAYIHGGTGMAILGRLSTMRAYHEQAERLCTDEQSTVTTSLHLAWSAETAKLLRDTDTAADRVDRLLDYAEKHDLKHFYAAAHPILAWTLVQRHEIDAGIGVFKRGIQLYRDYDIGERMVEMLADLGWAYLQRGNAGSALQYIEEALSMALKKETGWYLPEIYRLRGEVRQGDQVAEAERDYRQAIAIARTQRAALYELRAVIGLIRLQMEYGDRGALRDMLHGVCAKFEPGSQCADLTEAQTLLQTLT